MWIWGHMRIFPSADEKDTSRKWWHFARWQISPNWKQGSPQSYILQNLLKSTYSEYDTSSKVLKLAFFYKTQVLSLLSPLVTILLTPV